MFDLKLDSQNKSFLQTQTSVTRENNFTLALRFKKNKYLIQYCIILDVDLKSSDYNYHFLR